MPGPPPSASDDPTDAPPRAAARPWYRTGAAVVLSAAIVALPLLGAYLSYSQIGEPADRDMVIAAMLVAAALVGAAWAGLGVLRVASRIDLRAGPARLPGHQRLNDAELVRAVLAAHDLPCRRCGYNLRGLAPGVCPECREPIEVCLVADDRVVALPWITRLVLTACVAQGVLQSVLLYQSYRMWPFGIGGPLRIQIGVAALYLIGPGAFALGAVALGFQWLRGRGRRTPAERRLGVLRLAAGLLAMVGVIDAVAVVILSM